MTSFSRLLTIALGLTAVGCAVLAYQQYFLLKTARADLATLEKERTVLREKLDRLEKNRPDRPRWSPAASPSAGPTVIAETSGETGGPQATRPEGGGFNRARAFMDSPQAQQFMAMQQKAALDSRYAALFRKLQLSPAELEKFKDLLVERQTAAMDVMTAARNQGMDVRASGQEISQLIRDSQSEVDQNIRAALGETGYQEYKDYERTLPQRATVSQLEQRLSYTSSPLRPDQVDQLARILADTAAPPGSDARNSNSTFAVTASAGPIPVGMSTGFLSANSAITDDALARAQGVLTSAQMDALRLLQQEQQKQAQIAQEMRNRMGRGATPTSPPGAPSGPVLIPAVPLPGGG